MPIPAAEKEKLRHEMRKMLNRKNNKSRLHKIQKNVQVYDIGMPLLAALERKLDIQMDSIRRGFCINEVRLSAKRANNKANKYGFPEEPEKPTPRMSMTAMLSMPDSALSMDMENGKDKDDKTIFRQRLTHEQVDRLQKIAEDADWSLLKIPRSTREAIAIEVGVSVEQFKNFFSNAKPKDKKKMLPRKDGNPEEAAATSTLADSPNEKQLVYRQRLSVWQIEELTAAAIGVDWSLINMSKPEREGLSNKVGITVDQLKNFFSNAKPKELKKQK